MAGGSEKIDNGREILQVVYRSVPAPCASAEEIHEMCLKATSNNVTLGLTGFLVVMPDSFMSLIEGERPKLMPVLENISRDRRHTGMTVLREAVVEARRFVGWRCLDVATGADGALSDTDCDRFALRLSRGLKLSA